MSRREIGAGRPEQFFNNFMWLILKTVNVVSLQRE